MATMSAMAVLLRLPDLKFSSCLAVYSQCWPAKRGKTSLDDSPSAPWHTKQEPPTIFLARASSACAMADGDNQAAQSNKTTGAKRPGVKRVFMIDLNIERMGEKFKKLP